MNIIAGLVITFFFGSLLFGCLMTGEIVVILAAAIFVGPFFGYAVETLYREIKNEVSK